MSGIQSASQPFSLCDDEQRLAALRAYGILDTPPEQAFDDITRLIAQVCKAPVAVVNFLADGRQWFKSEVGLGVRELPLDVSICAHALAEPDLLVVPDTTADPRFRGNPLVTGEPRLRFYAGAPLRTPDGHTLGTLCVLDYRTRGLDEGQAEALRALARQVMSQLELRRALAARGLLLDERRRAEQARREGQVRLDAVVENMTEGLVLCDAKGNILSMNPASLAIHEFASQAEMLQKLELYPGLFELRDANDRPLPLAEWPLSRALRGERFAGFEVRVRRTDTGKSWIGRYGGTPVRDAAGRVELVVLTVSDVSDRWRAEAELRSSEERLRLGLEAGRTGTWDWDIVNDRVTWSDRVYEFHGLRPGEFGGRIEDFAKLVHPDDVSRVNEAIQASIRGRLPYDVEFRVVHPNGDVRWIATSGTVHYAADGTPLRMLGATSDVTDSRRGERLLAEQKRVLEMIADGGPVREVLAAIARLVEQQSAGDLCSVLLLDPRTQRLHLGAAPSLPEEYNAAIEGIAIGENVGSCGTAAHARQTVVVADIERDPRWHDYKGAALRHGLRACWSKPIVARDGRVLGTVANYCRSAGDPNEQHLQLLEAAAHLAGIALERQQAADDARTLYEVGLAMSGETDVHKLVQTITDAGTTLSRAQFGAFFYNATSASGDAYMLYTISGAPREAFERYPIPRATALFGPTFRGEGVIRLDDVTADPRYGQNAPRHGMPEGHLPVRSYLALPVKSRGGEVIGGLFFGHERPGVFTPEAESLLTGIAAQAGLVLDNADLLRKSRKSEAKFRQLANTIPQLAWMARPDGWIFWYNDQWYRYTGTTPADMEGWGWQRVHDPAVLPTVTERWQGSIATGEPFEMEFPLRSSSGEFRSFLTRVNPLRGEDGTILLWFGTNTDVTEFRRQQEALAASEARLRAVVQATPECVKVVAPDGGLSYMNPAGLGMIESDTAESVQGACVFELVASEYRKQWEDNHRRVCGGERLTWEFEIVGLRGTRRWMETHAVPLPLPDGRNAQLAVTRDVTQRKQHEVQRESLLESERTARAEAERVSRMKDEFLATLSHELRTPLNAILGWSQILRGGGSGGDDLAQGLATIERNARAQTQIIEDLLDMSRIISGKVRLDVQRIDLVSVVEAALQTARPAADAKEIRLQPVLDPLAGPVSGDPNRLQQVFWNLLSNAIKFTPRGGRVQVLLERVNSHLEVSIIDTGEGIRPEFLPYVFDRFRQADASTTRRHGGLGLGLAIVKQLVELHGGTVRAKSAGVGRGSTFAVTLPLTVVHPEPQPEAERRHPTSSIAAPDVDACHSLAGVRVLVVDDEPDARGLVERLLRDCEATVTTAGSAAEAVDRLTAEAFDVLVSDIGMPGEDGYSLIRRVRKLGPPVADIPALALTAYARSEDRQRAILAGFHLHVAKPVEPSELITMVASLASRRPARST